MNENELNLNLDAVLDAGKLPDSEANRQALAASVEGRIWLAMADALAELPEPAPAPDVAPAVLAQLAGEDRPLPSARPSSPAAASSGPGSRLAAWWAGLGRPSGLAWTLGTLGLVVILALAFGGPLAPGSLSGTITDPAVGDVGWAWLLGGGIALVGAVWWWSRHR